MPKSKTKTSVLNGPLVALTVREFVAQEAKRDGGHYSSIAKIAAASGVSYPTLYRHVRSELKMSYPTALKLEQWSFKQKKSEARISAEKTMRLAS